jgi:hypothetical protein
MQAGGYIMQVKTKLKAGALNYNHNQTLVRDRVQRQPLKVKTKLKASALHYNHNQTLVRDQAKRK